MFITNYGINNIVAWVKRLPYHQLHENQCNAMLAFTTDRVS